MASRNDRRVKTAAQHKTRPVIVRRASSRVFGVFIDGVGLDRASRRLQKKVDLTNLLKSLTSGAEPAFARYYTLLPKEDDSRHRSFLDAVSKAGLEIFTKRLPPKGIERQISTDAEISADMVSFALGYNGHSDLSLVSASGQFSITPVTNTAASESSRQAAKEKTIISPHPATENSAQHDESTEMTAAAQDSSHEQLRTIVVVCPSKELAYSLALCRHIGADTVSADFAQFAGGDILKSAAKWIDLSDSQTIWK